MVFLYFVFWRKFKKMLSDNLEKTIKRAISYAIDRQQEYVTLEHLLLALIDDKDALGVLNACDINIKNLKISLLKYIDQELKNITSAVAQESEPSASFQRIFSERESHAVYFLQKQDMSRLDALNFISHGIKKNENETEEEIEEETESKENEFIYPSTYKQNDKKSSDDFIINLIEKALKLRQYFPPYVCYYIELLIENNDFSKAKKYLYKSWCHFPHPEYRSFIKLLSTKMKISYFVYSELYSLVI